MKTLHVVVVLMRGEKTVVWRNVWKITMDLNSSKNLRSDIALLFIRVRFGFNDW